jgi:multiple sugar transport system substrate-binding protein
MPTLSVRSAMTVAGVAATIGLAACGSSTSSSGTSPSGTSHKGTITFLAADYSAKTKPYWTTLISQFERKYPGEKVNLQVVSWDDINQKVTTLVSTHQQPDILNLDTYANFAGDHLLVPAKDVLSPNIANGFLPKFAANGVVGGQQYGIPLLASVRALFYNKAIFRQAGITKPPATWDQMRADALQIKARTGQVGYGMPMGPEEAQAEFSLFAMANGGGWVHGGQWAIDQPANVTALNFMNELANKDRVTEPNPGSTNVTELWKVFGAGKIGMVEGSSFLPVLLQQYNPKLQYGAAPVPVPAGKPPVTLGVEDYLQVFKSTTHAGVVKDFLDFFFQPSNYMTFIRREGFLPATKAGAAQIAGSDPQQRVFIKAADSAQFYPATNPTWGAISGKVKNDLGTALQGKTPQAVLSALQNATKQHG